jgi:hypothetical protein
MPKLFGLNLVAVFAAAVAFFIVGFLWYGVIFSDMWMAEMGMTKADDDSTPVTYLIGFVITLMQVIGLGLVLKWRNAAGLSAAVTTAATLWLVFALPFCVYGYLYAATHSTTLLMIDASHLLVGWVVSVVVLSLLKV